MKTECLVGILGTGYGDIGHQNQFYDGNNGMFLLCLQEIQPLLAFYFHPIRFNHHR